jgi:hypothetical protein
VVGFLALGLIASSNYVINELLGAGYDCENLLKRSCDVALVEERLP